MKSLPKYFAALILGCFFITFSQKSYSHSNRIEFERISIDQGLSQSTVYCILQDYLGYMWFGTEDGLNRYDGFNFKVFLNDPNQPNSLSNNRIMTLLEDSHNNLWIGTLGGGLNRYNRMEGSFTVYKHNANDPHSIAGDIVMSLYEDQDGRIWAGTAGAGVSVFDPKTEKFISYSHNPADPRSLPGNLVRSLYVSSSSTTLLGTDKGLCVFNPHDGTFTHINSILNTNHPILSRTVVSIIEDHRGDIWFSVDESGAVKYSPQSLTYDIFTESSNSRIPLSSNAVLNILQDDQQNYWFGTYNGLQKYDQQLGITTIYQNRSADPYSLSSNLIRCIYEDREGNMWIGTYRDGINKFNRKYRKFSAYRSNPSIPGSLPTSSIRSLYENHNGNIYIGTYGYGLVELNTKTDFVTQNPLNIPQNADSKYKQVTAITSDSLSNLWVGFDGGGLLRFDSNKRLIGTYTSNPLQNAVIPSNRIRCLYVDKKGTLWVGTTGDGMCKFDHKSNTFTTYKPNPHNQNTSLSQERILCIYEDNRNNFWVGTSSEGLNLFDRETEKVIQFKNEKNNTSSLSSNRILSIYNDSRGRLWIGTGGGGLNLFDYETKSFRAFRTEDGLPNDVIYGILEDDQGALWLSTNYGICRFEYRQGGSPIIRNFTRADGLQSNEFTESSYLKLKSGDLVFAGINGLNVFNPLKINDNQNKPSVIIENVTLFNNSKKTGERITNTINPLETEKLHLPYNQNNITLSFIALHFQNPQGNTYLYKLEGFDNEWVSPVVGQRFATYTNLSPGSYTFRVIAANCDGIWNDSGDSIRVIISPPFWRTWWFISLLVLVAFGIVILIIRLREAGLVQMKNLLEEKVRMRTKEILVQKEEIQSQRDYLSELNTELQQKNEEIMAQHNELERTQKQLIQSEKMASIGILTAGIAHEINNPINFVYAGVSSITKDFNDIDHVLEVLKGIEVNATNCDDLIARIIELKKRYEFDEAHQAILQTLDDIKLGAERTAEIVEGLRNFSRTENEEWNLADIHRIIDGVLVLLKNKYKNNIEIIKAFDETLTEIECKTGKINQVIMNLLSNAIDAIEERGSITISTHKRDEVCIISIKDTGKGMDESTASKIFDPFFTTKAIGRGVGLGLSITYGIIQEHEGFIDVKSSPGEGTEFIITLPLKQEKQ